jgi:signal transduction histidine kinase
VSLRTSVTHRLRRPRTTVRWRLTLLYGGLFLACGAGLLAITYTLVEHATVTSDAQFIHRARALTVVGPSPPKLPPVNPAGLFQRAVGGNGYNISAPTSGHLLAKPSPAVVRRLLRTKSGRQVFISFGAQQRISDLHQLVVESSIALAIMALISAGLGWVVAGRVLAPLRTIRETTQQISETSLDRRLAIRGPRDELRQLADTIDGLLERLEGAFDAQRRFVANASHELRTPLTAARALLEMVLTDPRATVKTFRGVCEQVLDESAQQEQLIDALLALAQGQRGIERHETIDLATLAAEVLDGQRLEAAARGLTVREAIEPASVSGDRRLLERLISNLVENAIRHNADGGHIRVAVASNAGHATLTVQNTGPVVPGEEIERLLQPFQRLTADRTGHREGIGLGLSIVAAIASAHHATLDTRPGADGGLDVRVSFAAVPHSNPPSASAASLQEAPESAQATPA